MKDTLKNQVDKWTVSVYFCNITDNNEAWQLKILQDPEFELILEKLNFTFDGSWLFLVNLATHPGCLYIYPFIILIHSDAKVLLPRGIILAEAAKHKNIFYCNSICALLSDDNDLKVLELV